MTVIDVIEIENSTSVPNKLKQSSLIFFICKSDSIEIQLCNFCRSCQVLLLPTDAGVLVVEASDDAVKRRCLVGGLG